MADASRLKKKAADLEARRQYDRALAVYDQVLTEIAGEEQEADIPLYNRAGDLYLRQGNVDRAVTLYEKAVDLYAEGGFFNNAIALCNKILRHAPNRSSVYYKLGKISAQKGFNSDAKQNFLEFAARMQRAGKMDEAFHALKEFADLCPSQDDVRLMLAEQLTRAGRKTEAFEQLQILHEQLDAEGRSDEAAATLERLQALRPGAEARKARGSVSRRGNELVFLDLDVGPEPMTPPTGGNLEGLEPTSLVEEVAPAASARPLTPREFAAIELPPPADEARERAAAPTALAGLPVLDTAVPPRSDVLDAGPDVETPQAAATAVEPPPTESRAAEKIAAIPPPAAASANSEPMTGAGSDHLVDLGEWLRADEGPRSSRMVAEGILPPPIDEQADFGEMLQRFKEGVAANIDEADYAAHYDLGIAFKEMGLVDEAIGEFQKALRGTTKRVPTYEALGQCFVEQGQHEIAITVLGRALREPAVDEDQLAGVLYLMGAASEALGKMSEATAFYQRVVAVDIGFRDVAERLTAVSQASS